MTQKSTFLANLFERRVPQIVGMYIAAAWLVIELGDWITGRFGLPAGITSYAFLGLLVMLPTVVVLAYNHGTPGKDEWRRSERAFLTINALATIGILYLAGPTLVVEAATETVEIADETGAVQRFEVARQGHHRELLAFFWRNDSADGELDWLAYGLPLLLRHDLNRVSPVLTVTTPLDSRALRRELENRGFDELVDEPQGLRIQIARERNSAIVVAGSYDVVEDRLIVRANVADAETGGTVAQHEIEAEDWFSAIDTLTAHILKNLAVEVSDNRNDEPLSQHFSDSLTAVRHYTDGAVALQISNDYPAGIAEFSKALQIDPAFAEASGALSLAQYFNGDTDGARLSATQALNNSYRLSQTSRFVLKANRYVFDGDFSRAGRVVDMWTELEPNSTPAYDAQATLARLQASSEAFAKAERAYDRLLELNPNDYEIFRQKAELEQQRGDLSASASYLKQFLEHQPDSSDALLQLANVYQAQGELDVAQATLEDAAVLSDNPLQSEIGLARLEARRGHYDTADSRLERLLVEGITDQQHVDILSAKLDVAVAVGRVGDGLDLMGEINDISKSNMPPMIRLVSLETQFPMLLLLLNRTDEAVEKADAIIAQLQPPLDATLFFTYTSIYEVADDREAFRHWAAQTTAREGQLPEIFSPFVEMQQARLALWDEDAERATGHIDRAAAELGQSLIQLRDNLGISTLLVTLADLYVEAGETGKSAALLDQIQTVYPASAHAKLVRAKAQLADGNPAAARTLLEEALAVWAPSDADYIFTVEAKALLADL